MGSGPWSPFCLKNKAPLNLLDVSFFDDLQTLHIPPKQETRGLDTTQATSLFPWWLLLFFQDNFEAKS